MPAQQINSSELPEKMRELKTSVRGLFTAAVSLDGTTYYAWRSASPMFVVAGDDLMEVFDEATGIIDRFLNKMYRYGFRI